MRLAARLCWAPVAVRTCGCGSCFRTLRSRAAERTPKKGVELAPKVITYVDGKPITR